MLSFSLSSYYSSSFNPQPATILLRDVDGWIHGGSGQSLLLLWLVGWLVGWFIIIIIIRAALAGFFSPIINH
jgi:hypothetical protein